MPKKTQDEAPKLRGPGPGTKAYFVLNPRTMTVEEMHAAVLAALRQAEPSWAPLQETADDDIIKANGGWHD